jgi:hypothetical protein
MVFSLVVASTYITAISLAGSTLLGYSPLNPAIAIGIYFSQVFTGSPVDGDMWIWCLIPFVGSLFAALFFEIVFKKTVIYLKLKQEKKAGIEPAEANSNSSEEENKSQKSGSL